MARLREQEYTLVFVDSTYNREDEHAGFGIYFGYNSPWNISESYWGIKSKQAAEVIAMRRGIEISHEYGLRGCVRIYTSSDFLIDHVKKSCKDKEFIPSVNEEEERELMKLRYTMTSRYVTTPGVPALHVSLGKTEGPNKYEAQRQAHILSMKI